MPRAREPFGLQAALQALRGRELVFDRHESAFAGAEEYTFKHAILHEVTYESVLKRVRRAYHRLVADWLIAESGRGRPSSSGRSPTIWRRPATGSASRTICAEPARRQRPATPTPRPSATSPAPLS